MHCPYCGKPVDTGTAYCPWCGGGLREDTSSPIPEGVLDRRDDPVPATPHESQAAETTAPSGHGAGRDANGPWELITTERLHEAPSSPRRQDPEDSGAVRMVVGLVVAAAAMAAAFLVFTRGCAMLGPAPIQQDAQQVAQEEPAVQEEPAAGPEDAAEEEQPQEEDGVTPRGSLAEYSWGELSAISAEVSAAPNRDSALEVARRYNLVDDTGIPTGSTRQVALADGSTLDVYLADVYHDDLVGGGKAGLTFLGWNLPLSHAMNATDTNSGGWASSDMRAWLSVDGMRLLPQELQDVVVPVAKSTNNVGNTHDPASVDATEDALWIPSVTEVAGTIDWVWSSDADNSGGYNAVLNAEGSQYAVFSAVGVNTDGPNAALALRGNGQYQWWLRTPSASVTSNFRYVTDEGNPCGFGGASVERGVCVGFCV